MRACGALVPGSTDLFIGKNKKAPPKKDTEAPVPAPFLILIKTQER
jgi:hypothetical protein